MKRDKALFAMAFHCHQPVDNFGWELERAYESAYLPLVSAFEEFPGIKASLHISGNMLEWFEQKHPRYLERLAGLVRRGRIEIMGGGCFEPVLAMIPERDAEEQIRMHGEIVDRIFAVRPRGAWIAEKVWEPETARTLVKTGTEYTIVDDYHLLRAGIREDDIYGPCVTESDGSRLTLFPSLTRLRYYMPFKRPEVTVDLMRSIAGKRREGTTCFFFADDAEKFGAWPYTYWWVHKKGWLKDFFTMLLDNQAWLETATYSEVLDRVPPKEVGCIPPSSYAEMMEWSDGDFRNFLTKYPEAGRMHERMMAVSGMLEAAENEAADHELSGKMREARTELFKAQTNCAYWHGTFGGVYLPHLRSGVYSHLICAENIMDGASRQASGAVRVVERESGGVKKETLVRNDHIDVFLDPSAGGAVTEFDYRPLCLNLTNTVSRVREGYHDKLEKGNSARVRDARKAIMRGDFADVHDVLGVKERGLEKVLAYDGYRRFSFLTHVFSDSRPLPQMRNGCHGHDRFLKEAYVPSVSEGYSSADITLSRRDKVFTGAGRSFDLEVVKSINVGTEPGLRLSHRLIKHSGGGRMPSYAVELNFSIWDEAVRTRPALGRSDRFALRDKHSGVELDFRMNRSFTVFMYPIYTVNETEMGLSKTFQGISVVIGDAASRDDMVEMPPMDMKLSIRRTW